MSKSNYRHKVTKLIGQYDDKFAAVFGSRLEKVSDRVVKSGTTVEENAAALEKADETANAATDKNEDSSKEGNK